MSHANPLPLPRNAILALSLACGLALPAHAQDKADQQKQLEQARTDLQSAARRVAELSAQTGVDANRIESIHIDSRLGENGKPRLGVLLGIDEQAGVRIAGVTPGGGADKAGLKTGDRLLRIRGKAIHGASGEARVADARAALAVLEQGKPVRVSYQRDGKQHDADVTPAATQSLVFARTISRDGGDDPVTTVIDSADLARLKDLGPQLRGEVIRLSRPGSCLGDGCTAPLLAEALRWDGLNLLALEPQLGRYFGTERGVLVLSQGALPGLQAGDVIHKIEGKAVASPREAMQAMTARKPGEQAKVTVMRDRSVREVQITVPERIRSLDFIPVPPERPAPPVPAVRAPPLPTPQAAARAVPL
ncbi:PDZ domain-containing protein [Pseudoxanthomonas daejeonensis]|uniref:PDZ domain-containing protein n=1 Tax=Pseudoxanthomonas daejeonensis TaxID=266062 RepID=A0ABQ6Z860_9GAMM|nr:PDZ domain-containing protein [Pseudoxanthomonas daejeonensis]KAF1695366.1 hypothetical protein CSC65_06245 [Pseudoxanthomonas daejeonensis]